MKTFKTFLEDIDPEEIEDLKRYKDQNELEKKKELAKNRIESERERFAAAADRFKDNANKQREQIKANMRRQRMKKKVL
jgi:uncharacterized glyoxalase superfamily metalloenzyme YdcJ